MEKINHGVGHSFQYDRMLEKMPSEASSVNLPMPFFPSSLAQQNAPRDIPPQFKFPSLPQEVAHSTIDTQDIGSADGWIPRDPRLVRLTGKHPFNAEAKLRDLYGAGFFTPSNLFYVRNHGAVPVVDQERADKWELTIHGLCTKPTTLTLKDLRTKFQVVTIPVTLVCAGNRRKEQNIVQQSLGFNWGAGGLSTALFTGVYLSDVLEHVHPTKPAKHVIFEGSDKLPNGPYGTSQLLSWARDKGKAMLLSWAMNGLPLEPDHGFPLRLVVPGQIGGRSVKWLSRIEISEKESQHYLHFHDNKVLPMPLGPEKARAEKDWWYDPRYIIRDLNPNSAIARPDHNEVLDPSEMPPDATYQLKGYAYAGGGRRVSRIEISWDDGDSWNIAKITYPEDLFRAVAYSDSVYGRLDLTESDLCFCWCFWTFEINLDVLRRSDAVMVRCMDESLALQPRDMYWNATGMMNNWWFRVRICQIGDGKLQFEHPTMAGRQEGGWMQRLKDDGLDPSKPVFSIRRPSGTDPTAKGMEQAPDVIMTKPDIKRQLRMEDLTTAEAKAKAWFVVRGEVYNGSGYFKEHPGGAEAIMLVAGEDATEDFMAIHSSDAKKKLAEFHIGTLVEPYKMVPQVNISNDDSQEFLNPRVWKKVVVSSIECLQGDAKRIRFALPNSEQPLGLPFGQHIYLRLRTKAKNSNDLEGELIQRTYTPMIQRDARGFMELLVRIYRPTSKSPVGGRMTTEIDKLSVGDEVEVKGPTGNFTWKGQGMAVLHGKEYQIKEVGMICAGTGITPVIQALHGIFSDPLSKDVRVWVLDINRSVDDILCREELDQFALDYSSRLRLHYTLTGTPPKGWRYSTGRATDEMIRRHMPIPGSGKLICIGGPLAMKEAVTTSMINMGWDSSVIV